MRITKGASSLPPFALTSGFAPKFPFPSLSNACCEMLCIHVKSFGDHTIHNTVLPGFGYFSSNRISPLPRKMKLHTLHFIPPQSQSDILTPHYIVKHPTLHCRGCDTFCFAYLQKERCFEEYREKSLRHVAIVAKFQDDNKTEKVT